MEGELVLDMRPNPKDTVQLYNAAMTGEVAILHKLLKNDPLILNESSLTSFCESPLHIASSLGHLDFVRALLAKKPSMASEGDSLGRRSLHLASAEGHVEIMRALLKADADISGITDGDYRTPLHLAAMRGRVQVVRELVRFRPTSVMVFCKGDTVLHLCVKYCQLEALVVLVDLLGDHSLSELLNARDADGNTVLHLAVQLSPLKIAKYLVSLVGQKANANALNSNNCTPLDISEKCPKDLRSLQIQLLLLEAGAKRAKDLDITALASSSSTAPSPAAHNDVDHDESPGGTGTGTNKKKSKIRKIMRKTGEYLTEEVDWISQTHGNLMVVATVIATMSFQALLSPPGGVFQDTSPRAGSAIFSGKEEYERFNESSKVSFTASLVVILLHFGGFPLQNKVGTWLITIAMCTAIWYVFQAYKQASKLVSGDELDATYIIWKVALGCVIVIHTVRFVHWLLPKLKKSPRWFRLLGSVVLALATCLVVFVLGSRGFYLYY